jgi:hypothetical protein
MGQFVVARARTHHELSAGKCPDVALSDAICANLLKLMMDYPLAKRLTGITWRTGALLRWQKSRGILRSVKDPQHGRFDLWEIAV